MTVRQFRDISLDYANQFPYHKRVGTVYGIPYTSQYTFQVAHMVFEELPVRALQIVSRMPGIGSKKLRETSKLATSVKDKMYNM
jgi:hypothetical protein